MRFQVPPWRTLLKNQAWVQHFQGHCLLHCWLWCIGSETGSLYSLYHPLLLEHNSNLRSCEKVENLWKISWVKSLCLPWDKMVAPCRVVTWYIFLVPQWLLIPFSNIWSCRGEPWNRTQMRFHGLIARYHDAVCDIATRKKKTISRRASDLAAWSAISWRSHGVTRGLQRVSLRGVAMSRLAEAIPRPSTQCHGYQKAIPRRGKNYFLFLLKKHKKHNRQVWIVPKPSRGPKQKE